MTEFYRQYLAVAVFVVAAFVMVGAMLGLARLLRTPNEAFFIFRWAVDFDGLGWFGLVEMTIFIGVLLLGLAYVWRKGLLKWA